MTAAIQFQGFSSTEPPNLADQHQTIHYRESMDLDASGHFDTDESKEHTEKMSGGIADDVDWPNDDVDCQSTAMGDGQAIFTHGFQQHIYRYE